MPYGTAFIETLISNMLNISTKVITEVDRRVTAKALQQLLDALKRADDNLVAKVQQIKSLATQVRDLEETNLQQGCRLQEKDIIIARLQQDIDFYRLGNHALEEENVGIIKELAELDRLVSALRSDLDGTARHAASLENQLKEQQQHKEALEATLEGMTRYANGLLKNVPQNPKVETKGFYAMVQWRSDEPDDVSPVEVFIAQTHDDLGDQAEHVFYYAGDYSEEYIRNQMSRENSHEEWYIVSEDGLCFCDNCGEAMQHHKSIPVEASKVDVESANKGESVILCSQCFSSQD